MIIKGHNEVFDHIFNEFDTSGYQNQSLWFLVIRDDNAYNHGGYQTGPLVLLDDHIVACPNFQFGKQAYSNAQGPILWRIESRFQGNNIPYLMISIRPIFYKYGIFEITEIDVRSPFAEPKIKRFI